MSRKSNMHTYTQITIKFRIFQNNVCKYSITIFRPVFLQSRYEARIFENEMEFVSPVRFQARDNDLKGLTNTIF